jgi:hypothetical protein
MTLLSKIGQSGSSTLPEFNWATKPAAADYSGRLIRIADVGINGSLWFSDGTRWIHESPIVLQQAAKGWIVPSLAAANAATYAQTGTTITVTSAGHNIPATVHDGKDVYLAIASGDAVAGWYSNFTRTGADTFTCKSSVSQSTSGTVNTNTAETIISPVTTTILGGVLGTNGSLRTELLFGWLGSGNSKTLRARFGSDIYYSLVVSTGSGTSAIGRSVRNRNSYLSQISQATGASGGGGIGVNTALAIDTSVDFDNTVALTLAAPNEFVTLESMLLEVLPS